VTNRATDQPEATPINRTGSTSGSTTLLSADLQKRVAARWVDDPVGAALCEILLDRAMDIEPGTKVDRVRAYAALFTEAGA